MNFKKDKEYVAGRLFSNTLELDLKESKEHSLTRLELISNLVRGKKVIHAGCLDHSKKLIERKLTKNRWLHKLISENAKRCLGVDIDKSGIEFMRDELGYKDLVAGDMFSKKTADKINTDKWDYLVLGEILEHTDNPVAFLKKIKILYKDNVKKMIITVPNAFSINNFLNALRKKEVINSDHRYWFTPYTITKILNSAGMELEELYFCQYFDTSKLGLKHKLAHPLSLLREKVQSIFLKRNSTMKEGLVAILNISFEPEERFVESVPRELVQHK